MRRVIELHLGCKRIVFTVNQFYPENNWGYAKDTYSRDQIHLLLEVIIGIDRDG